VFFNHSRNFDLPGSRPTDIGIRANTASSPPNLKTTWQGANTFLSYGSGKDVVYP